MATSSPPIRRSLMTTGRRRRKLEGCLNGTGTISLHTSSSSSAAEKVPGTWTFLRLFHRPRPDVCTVSAAPPMPIHSSAFLSSAQPVTTAYEARLWKWWTTCRYFGTTNQPHCFCNESIMSETVSLHGCSLVHLQYVASSTKHNIT